MNNQTSPTNKNDSEVKEIPLTISKCEATIKEIFGKSSDVVIQTFETRRGEALIAYIDGLTNKDLIDRDIITPLKAYDFNGDVSLSVKASFSTSDSIPSVVGEMLNGNTALFFRDSTKVYVFDFKQWDKRTVDSPDSEAVVRGPKEGFTENIRTTTALLRRKIKTPKLIIENFIIGRQTNTIVSLAYIEGIVKEETLSQVRSRLSEIDTDAILESGYIEQHIERNFLSLIPSMGMTQKPDILAAKLLEGRVGILCDGTPHVLTIPHLFIENLQTGEDYYSRTLIGSFMRVIRLVALFISVLLPGLFLSVITYHHEMIPTAFLVTIVASTEKTPLPLGAELFFLMLMFELLRESGTRLPKAIGSAVSIVGALIIGDAAVTAGIVSAPVVIIIALTAVCSFTISSLNEFVTINRLIFLVLGGTMGLIGIAAGIMLVLTEAVSTDSFGVPIFSSMTESGMKDTALRFPLWSMKFRPKSLVGDNKRRQK